MKEEKFQSNNHEVQALEMARQVLGRVKEMDLTDEQKKEVMGLIDQAQTAEKIDKSKALNLYNQLKQYLGKIKQESSGEVLDDLEIKRRQIVLIDDTLANIKVQGIEKYKKLYEAYKLMRNTVIQSNEMKTEIVPNNEVEIIAREILTEKQVWEEIKERLFVSDVFPFLNNKVVDEDGNLLYLSLGFVGQPEVEVEYYLAGRFKLAESKAVSNLKTILGNNDNLQHIVKNKPSKAGIIATYNEERHAWEPGR